MAMGNNPMMYTDVDGKTWNPFKAIGQAWDYAWDKGNQFAQWVDEVGIPSANIGYGMSSSGQIQPVGNINGQALFSNESQYEVASQNAVDAINNARGEYFSRQQMNANYSQQLNNRIMNVPYSTVQRNRNVASLDRRGFLNGIGQSVEDFFTFLDNTTIAIADGDSEYLTGLISSISLGNMLGGGFEISLPNDSYSAGYILAGMIPAYILKRPEQVNISLFKTRFGKGNFRGPKGWEISRDLGRGRSHGGSYYKLKNPKGHRTATLDEFGNILRD